MSKSQWRLPLTPTGVRHEASSGMTIHTLVFTIDTVSHAIVILLIGACQKDFKSISHLAQAIVTCV